MNALLLCACALLLDDAAPTLRISPQRHRTRRLLVAGGVLLVGVLLLTGPASLIASLACAAATIAWVVRDRRRRAHAAAIRSHTSTFLGYVIGDLRAGNGMPHALGVAAQSLGSDTPAVLIDAVRIAAARAAAGGDGADVLVSSGCPDLARVGHLWKIAGRHGVPLVSLCENAQQRIDSHITHAAATDAALQGPRATATVLSALPIVGIGMGGLLGADPLRFLLGGGIGGVLLVLGTALTAVGFLWSQTIITKATS